MSSDNPLLGYSQTSPNPLMRFFASVAVGKGISQEELASRLNEKSGRSLSGGNVSGHFETSHPKPSTIKMYSEALGVSDEIVRIKSGRRLDSSQVESWSAFLRATINRSATAFKPGTERDLKRVIKSLDGVNFERVLDAFVLASLTGELPSIARQTSWPSALPVGLIAIAAALEPWIDLGERLFVPVPNESLLWRIHLLLNPTGLLSPSEILTLIGLLRTILRAKGIEVARMTSYHRRNLKNNPLTKPAPTMRRRGTQ